MATMRGKSDRKRKQAWMTVALLGMMALLSGCVVYPAGYAEPHYHGYRHDRDWR